MQSISGWRDTAWFASSYIVQAAIKEYSLAKHGSAEAALEIRGQQ